jgi:hypothetical protein
MAADGSSPWEDPDFLAEAHGWIEAHVHVTGEIEQPHVRPWSTVLRVPTNDGDVWFKATVPGLGHDAGVTSILAGLRPDIVLAPLALDLDRGWMILPDGGERLREVVERERHPRRWLEIMPLYAELQIDAASHADELVAAGMPDYRASRLPDLADWASKHVGVQAPDRSLLEQLAADLDATGIPSSVQHDDLHDGNVFVRPGGGYAVFDWGDGCASHPFASLVVGLRGIAYRFELAERDPDLERIRDAYLEPWTAYGDRASLLRAVELADTAGRLTRALAWLRAFAAAGPDEQPESAESARGWFEEFSEAVRERAR